MEKVGEAANVVDVAAVAGVVAEEERDVEMMMTHDGHHQKVGREKLGFEGESWELYGMGNERSATGNHEIGKKRLVLAGLGTGIDVKRAETVESVLEDWMPRPERIGVDDLRLSYRPVCGASSDLPCINAY